MSDAYNVRSNGQRYYVYRMDGNVQVAEFIGDGAAAQAQRDAAIRNMRHSEQFPKKKEPETETGSDGWVEDQNLPEESAFTGTQPQPEVKPPADGEVLSPNAQAQTIKAAKKSQVPNPPPGQGASY
jgi:hypothetical protein